MWTVVLKGEQQVAAVFGRPTAKKTHEEERVSTWVMDFLTKQLQTAEMCPTASPPFL